MVWKWFSCWIRSELFNIKLSVADKHKMERFLRPDAPTVVSVYAPITFPPAGVLLFKQRTDGESKTPACTSKNTMFSGPAALIFSFLPSVF